MLVSKNVFSADNPQGSPLCNLANDPSETTRRMPQKIGKWDATLLGLLYTDGCVSRKGKSAWRLYFSNKATPLIELFRESITQRFGVPPERVRISEIKDGLTRAILDSKKVGDELIGRYGTFRTETREEESETDAHLLVEALKQSSFTAEFLRVVFTCDGGVNLYVARRSGKYGGTQWLIRGVYIACAHRQLQIDFYQLLLFLGISARIVPGDRKVKIETEAGLRAFHRYIGFVSGVYTTHTSRFWEGYTKQEILDMLIASYDDPAAVYNQSRFSNIFWGNDIVRSSWRHEEAGYTALQ